MTCAFCDSPAELRCAWPVQKFVVVRYGDLVVGDTVRRFADACGREGRPDATVEELVDFPPRLDGTLAACRARRTVTLFIRGSNWRKANSRPGRFKSFSAVSSSRVRVLRSGLCDQPVCDLHAREVDESRVYCRDHWEAWEHISDAAPVSRDPVPTAPAGLETGAQGQPPV